MYNNNNNNKYNNMPHESSKSLQRPANSNILRQVQDIPEVMDW